MFFDIFVHDHVLYFYICLERMFIMSEILKSSPSVCQISQNPKTNVFLKLQILFCSCWSWVTYTGKISSTYNFNRRNLLISSAFLIHCGERKKSSNDCPLSVSKLVFMGKKMSVIIFRSESLENLHLYRVAIYCESNWISCILANYSLNEEWTSAVSGKYV